MGPETNTQAAANGPHPAEVSKMGPNPSVPAAKANPQGSANMQAAANGLHPAEVSKMGPNPSVPAAKANTQAAANGGHPAEVSKMGPNPSVPAAKANTQASAKGRPPAEVTKVKQQQETSRKGAGGAGNNSAPKRGEVLGGILKGKWVRTEFPKRK